MGSVTRLSRSRLASLGILAVRVVPRLPNIEIEERRGIILITTVNRGSGAEAQVGVFGQVGALKGEGEERERGKRRE